MCSPLGVVRLISFCYCFVSSTVCLLSLVSWTVRPPLARPLRRRPLRHLDAPSLCTFVTHGACRCLHWSLHCWCFPIGSHSPPCTDTSFPLCRSCVLISPAARAMTPHAWTPRAELRCYCVFGGKVRRVRCFTFASRLVLACCSRAQLLQLIEC